MLIRQTIAYLPAQLIGPLSQFALAIVLTHWLSAAEYGLTMLIFASQELTFRISLAWWTSYMMRYYGTFEGDDAKAHYHRTEAAILLGSVGIQIAGTLAILAVIGQGHSPSFYVGACLFVITRSLLNFFAERTRTLGRIKEYSLIQIGAPLGGLALTLSGLNLLNGSADWVFFAFSLVQGVITMGMILRFGVARHLPVFEPSIIRAAWIFGLPMVAAGALNWLSGNVIRFIVEWMRDAAALGLLSVGWGIATRLSSVAALLVTAAAYPLAVKAMQSGKPEEAKRQISDNSALLLGVVAPACFGLIAIVEPVTRLMIAPEFQEVTIAIMPWALIAMSLRNVREHGWDQLYLLFENPRSAMILNGIEAIAVSVGTVMGLAYAGLTGAVIGAMVAIIVITIGDYFYVRRTFGLIAPFGMMARILVATALMFLAIRAMPQIGWPLTLEWSRICLAIFIGIIVYALAIAALFPGFLTQGVATLRARLASR